MTDEKTGRTPRHDPHDIIIIDTVHYARSRQHGRVDAGLAALGAVAGWLLAAGGAR